MRGTAARMLVTSVLIVSPFLGIVLSSSGSPPASLAARAPYVRPAVLPLSFEANRGQAGGQVRYVVHAGGYDASFSPSHSLLSFGAGLAPATRRNSLLPSPRRENVVSPRRVHAVRFDYVGANPSTHIVALGRLPGTVSYFLGNHPREWRTAIPTYGGITYHDLYAHTDLRVDGTAGRLEYSWVLRPGASPASIGMRVHGVQGIRPTAQGLRFALPDGASPLLETEPTIYQYIGGHRVPVPGNFSVHGSLLSFKVGRYNHRQPLIIDPTLIASTVFPSGVGAGQDIATDSAGDLFITGTAAFVPSSGLGVSPSNLGVPCAATASDFSDLCYNTYVAELNPAGDQVMYIAFLGGSESDTPAGVAVDASGHVWVAGSTSSTDFPTVSPLQSSLA